MTEARSSGQDYRPQHVAAFGFTLQLAALATLSGISLWSGSDAIAAAARFTFVGVPIWAVLYLTFNQLRRVRAEDLESSELKRARTAGQVDALFELDDEALLLERNRLAWLVRWLLPAATVIVGLYLLIGNAIGWSWSMDAAFSEGAGGLRRTDRPTLMMWFVVGIGFLCFLYARYAMALARLPEWRLLRAGASCMAGNALACLALALGLMAGTTMEWAEPLIAYVIRWAMFLLGIEFAANLVLDFYRPRDPHQVPRPSFDSRILGLLSEPGGIARSIADAINYQFGFEVSSTWFYQLLQRWLFPITAFTCLLVALLSSVVIVEADEQAVVERFGRLVGEPVQVLEPGLHVKWPFPIDRVRRAPVRRIRELVIGEATEQEDEEDHQAVLWTEAHEYVPELMLLVAAPPERRIRPSTETPKPDAMEAAGSKSVAVSLLMVSVPIHYRIRDLQQFLYTYVDPERLMEELAYQYLSDFSASADVDELIGPGRERFNEELKRIIQERLDLAECGIDVLFVGVRGAHPPSKDGVAAAFQGAVSSQTNMAATIHAAEGEARRILISVSGTESRAQTLDTAIREWDRLQSRAGPDPREVAELDRRIDQLLLGDADAGILPPSGQVAAMIAEARARASDLVGDAAAKVQVFSTEVAAYQAAPDLYQQRKLLKIYENLDHVRKYLILGDRSSVIVEYQTAEEAGLDRVLKEEVKK